eukprot:2689529-Prymnesium_polylepis.1
MIKPPARGQRRVVVEPKVPLSDAGGSVCSGERHVTRCEVRSAQQGEFECHRRTADALELLGQRHLIQRQAIRLRGVDDRVLQPQTDRVAPGHERTARWRADGLCVVVLDADAGRLGDPRRGWPGGREVTGLVEVFEAHIVNQNEGEMGRLRGSLAAREEGQEEEEERRGRRRCCRHD